MDDFDLYLNIERPSIGLYVRKGAGLPDLSDREEWTFAGTAAEDLLPEAVVANIRADGHAFRNME